MNRSEFVAALNATKGHPARSEERQELVAAGYATEMLAALVTAADAGDWSTVMRSVREVLVDVGVRRHVPLPLIVDDAA